ncbi:hypothetical protein GCM10019059_41220 [Camelimonas fluminis]|uniref:Uncharacterized protein n=1 Tax=Camelimonas fluminis TaxID=1576911 RepID=A0ABV7UC65_9HYPH|nr:hypothetical protein [Camelimonas fluminis]GHE78076.1 hypothetical protein GCM10019059_41220 [Camelimonas fluminis]
MEVDSADAEQWGDMLKIPYESLRVTEESEHGFRVEILPVARATDGVSVFIRREFFPQILAAISNSMNVIPSAKQTVKTAWQPAGGPSVEPALDSMSEDDVAAIWLREGVVADAEDHPSPDPAEPTRPSLIRLLTRR